MSENVTDSDTLGDCELLKQGVRVVGVVGGRVIQVMKIKLSLTLNSSMHSYTFDEHCQIAAGACQIIW